LAEKVKNADIQAVRVISRTAQSVVGRALAVNISKLGNGWLYLTRLIHPSAAPC
jgi:undecaprenyl-diphosphatase